MVAKSFHHFQDVLQSNEPPWEEASLPASKQSLVRGYTLNVGEADPREKVFLASGIRLLTEPTIPDGTEQHFQRYSAIPSTDWRRPDKAEIEILTAEHSERAAIQIVKLPDRTLNEVRAKLSGLIGSNGISKSVATDKEFAFDDDVTFPDEVKEAVSSSLGWMPNIFCITGSSKAYSTAVAYYQDNARIGLHLDSDGRQSSSAFPRAIFNIGDEPRFFVYSNLTLDKMANDHDLTESLVVALLSSPLPERNVLENIEMNINDFQKQRAAIFKSYENYPLVVLKLDPGEGWYSNRAEVMLHDGCSPMGPDYRLDVMKC